MVMLGINSGCASGRNGGYADMDVNDFARLLTDKEVQLLDVRTPDEYVSGHIAGAVNDDIYSSDFLAVAQRTLDKNRPVAVYCRSGKRSAEAAAILSRHGYKVTNLLGGIMAWENAGRPITIH